MILTLVRVRRITPIIIRPRQDDDNIGQFCRSLQIVTRRDTDGTVTTVIRTMLNEYPKDLVGSSELAQKTNLNRVTVIHHLKRLEDAGIVQKDQRKYRLSPRGFSDLVQRMRQQTEEMFEEAQNLARKIDEQYILPDSTLPPHSKRKLAKIEQED